MRSVKANTARVKEDKDDPSTGNDPGEYSIVLLVTEPELGVQLTFVVIA